MRVKQSPLKPNMSLQLRGISYFLHRKSVQRYCFFMNCANFLRKICKYSYFFNWNGNEPMRFPSQKKSIV